MLVSGHINMLSNAPFPSSISELIHIIELLNQSINTCRQIYCPNPDDSDVDTTDTVEPSNLSVIVPLSVLLGENADVIHFFVLFLLNQLQLDSRTIWDVYGIEISGKSRGVHTTVNIRFESFELFLPDRYLLDKFSAFNKETPKRTAPERDQFRQKTTNHLNLLHLIGARTHVMQCYPEIDSLKVELAEMQSNNTVINALLTSAKTKLRSKARQGSTYKSSKRDVSSMTNANAYETPWW